MKKILFFLTIVSLALVSCQNENLVEEPTQVQAQKPQLPAEINIVSAVPIPSDALLTRATSATNVNAYDVAGTYVGRLYNVNMNGNPKNDVLNIPVDITASSSNTFKFKLNEFKVGSMPGKLSVEIQSLTLNSNGTFHAANVAGAVKLKIGVLPFSYPAKLIDGSFTPVTGGHLLRFSLDSEGSIFTITIFTAHVDYEGTQQ